ncbi:FMN reductase [Actinacidiphila yanglinensis]|uniref:FMN reductase n=1 Tax=Actinacidiphila yanglinensis TaxID=310779 RepID=A0A1H6DBM5_9ACTN|nr:NADPH-dependent FMN reductase [Actinacidiphila yanglinensis]SEG81866.1 FMN reductase [Actinacidiphila yanglinensis]
MATILSVSGSPSATSRTSRLLRHLDRELAAQHHRVVPLDVRTLDPGALLGADVSHPHIARATELFAEADAVVIGTPVYKAAYSGLLKSLLDLLPQRALAGKTVLPLATGGTTAHVLAIDYALRPVLSAMGAGHVVQGWFVLDRHITLLDDGGVALDTEAAAGVGRALHAFVRALDRAPDTASAAGNPVPTAA